MKKVLWLGPIVHPDHQALSIAISPAANKWQLGFIDGLIQNDCKVSCLTYLPYQVWPKGKFWVNYNSKNISQSRFESLSVGYLNVFWIRDIWIPLSLFMKVIFTKSFKNVDYLFSYNAPQRHRIFSALIHWWFDIKCISIIADDFAKGNPFLTIFLSFGYYQRFSNSNKYFLDGGISKVGNISSVITKESTKILLFVGAISPWTGIVEFASLFNNFSEHINVELHIIGRGQSHKIELLAKKNAKIKYFGFVTDDVLKRHCSNAYAFINPRPLDIPSSENNFPSKLLLYLSYGKPILSTKTKGISPDYDSVLEYYFDEESLMNNIHKILSNKMYYTERCNSINAFCQRNNWESKISLLLKRIEE